MHYFGSRGARGGGLGPSRGRGWSDLRFARVLDKSELQVLLLSLLGHGPGHGYELIRAIKAVTKGAYAPSPGMIYPALNALAEAALAVPEAGQGGRRSFTITEAGRARLSVDAQALAGILARLEALPGHGGEGGGAIARAVANLSLVLANLPRDASEENLDQIVTLIDGAARQIERIA